MDVVWIAGFGHPAGVALVVSLLLAKIIYKVYRIILGLIPTS